MKVLIHQPEYLPWLGFFDRIGKADILVVLDDVGYQKNGFINRNKIKTADGWQWITIPVKGRSPNKKIKEVLIDNERDWKNKQLLLIKNNYCKSPNFSQYYTFLKETLEKKWDFISDLDIYLIESVMKFLDINIPIIRSSSMKVEGTKNKLLVNICKKVGADIYISGLGAKGYLNEKIFEENGIKVVFRNFEQQKYNQQFNNNFEPQMSILDLILNHGKESKNIIKNNGKN